MNVIIKEKPTILSQVDDELIDMVFRWLDSFGPGSNVFDVSNDISDEACDEILDRILTALNT